MLGPDGWQMPVCLSDVRPGGHFRYEWAKDGQGFHATGDYIAVAPNSRLEHVERMFLPQQTPDMHVVTTFLPQGAGTRMTMLMTLPDKAARDSVLASGMVDGLEPCYLRLDQQAENVAA